ncbi:MAG: glycosyltransferase family 2 protein, partial [Burkholderiales bacterium]
SRLDGVAFDVEIIVVDNCSTDRTEAVLAEIGPAISNFRSLTQTHTVSPEENLIAAFRLARGEFVVYLADDDALIPSRVAAVVAYMEQHPGIVACHSPWELWDKVKNKSQGQFYELDAPRTFDKDASLELVDFILERRIFPEIAIYRAQALHNVLYLPRSAYWAYVYLARMVQQGPVAFLPDPFYRSITRHWVGEKREQHGSKQTLTAWDTYRGGVEYLVQRALSNARARGITEDPLIRYRAAIDEFVASRMMIGLMGLVEKQDYIGALDLLSRLLLWGYVPQENAPHWRDFLRPRAAAQGIVATFDAMTTLQRLFLHEISDSDDLVRFVREARADLTITILQDARAVHQSEKDNALVVTRNAAARDSLVQAGFERGLIIAEQELLGQFEL